MFSRRQFVTSGLAAACVIAAPSADAATSTRGLLHQLTNQVRAQNGRSQLAQSAKLTAAAQAHAELMARSQQFGHKVGGTSPMQRARRQGYRPRYMAENIIRHPAQGSVSAVCQAMITRWMNSPGHRSNMLSSKPAELGIGVAQDSAGRLYAVQVFGRA